MARILIPNSTQIPDVLLDYWMAHLSGAEFKVLLYIARRTYGFGKDGDTISLHQIMHGIVTRDGRRLDYGTGLSKDTVCKALKVLEEKGLIVRRPRRDPLQGDLPNYYAINLDAEWPHAEGDVSPLPEGETSPLPGAADNPAFSVAAENPLPPCPKKRTPPCRIRQTPPCPKNRTHKRQESKRQ